MKLTKEQIIKGKEFRKEIKLSAYGEDCTVDIRPLTSLELEKVFQELEKSGQYVRNDDTLGGKLALMRKVAEVGIVDEELRNLLPDLLGSSVQEIGAAILDLSYSNPSDVKDFSQQTKA